MKKKLPFLVLGYLLGALSLVASISALVYTKASVGTVVADTDPKGSSNCKGI